jgi:hypothetical protein
MQTTKKLSLNKQTVQNLKVKTSIKTGVSGVCPTYGDICQPLNHNETLRRK